MSKEQLVDDLEEEIAIDGDEESSLKNEHPPQDEEEHNERVTNRTAFSEKPKTGEDDEDVNINDENEEAPEKEGGIKKPNI